MDKEAIESAWEEIRNGEFDNKDRSIALYLNFTLDDEDEEGDPTETDFVLLSVNDRIEFLADGKLVNIIIHNDKGKRFRQLYLAPEDLNCFLIE